MKPWIFGMEMEVIDVQLEKLTYWETSVSEGRENVVRLVVEATLR